MTVTNLPGKSQRKPPSEQRKKPKPVVAPSIAQGMKSQPEGTVSAYVPDIVDATEPTVPMQATEPPSSGSSGPGQTTGQGWVNVNRVQYEKSHPKSHSANETSSKVSESEIQQRRGERLRNARSHKDLENPRERDEMRRQGTHPMSNNHAMSNNYGTLGGGGYTKEVDLSNGNAFANHFPYTAAPPMKQGKQLHNNGHEINVETALTNLSLNDHVGSTRGGSAVLQSSRLPPHANQAEPKKLQSVEQDQSRGKHQNVADDADVYDPSLMDVWAGKPQTSGPHGNAIESNPNNVPSVNVEQNVRPTHAENQSSKSSMPVEQNAASTASSTVDKVNKFASLDSENRPLFRRRRLRSLSGFPTSIPTSLTTKASSPPRPSHDYGASIMTPRAKRRSYSLSQLPPRTPRRRSVSGAHTTPTKPRRASHELLMRMRSGEFNSRMQLTSEPRISPTLTSTRERDMGKEQRSLSTEINGTTSGLDNVPPPAMTVSKLHSVIPSPQKSNLQHPSSDAQSINSGEQFSNAPNGSLTKVKSAPTRPHTSFDPIGTSEFQTNLPVSNNNIPNGSQSDHLGPSQNASNFTSQLPNGDSFNSSQQQPDDQNNDLTFVTIVSDDYLKTRKTRHSEIVPSKTTFTKRDVTQYQKRHTIDPNPRYFAFYNRFVHDAFNPAQVESSDKLSASKISFDGSYSIDDDSRPGQVWTVWDKEMFFNLLARYSIHQVDLIASQMAKNELEVLTYYNLLKSQLKKLKNGEWKQHAEGSKPSLKKRRRGLVKYEDMPIAYEMSPFFVKYEDEQSEAVEKRLDEDRMEKLEEMGEEEYIRQLTRTGMDEASAVIDRTDLDVDDQSFAMLENLVRDVTRRILLDVIVTDLKQEVGFGADGKSLKAHNAITVAQIRASYQRLELKPRKYPSKFTIKYRAKYQKPQHGKWDQFAAPPVIDYSKLDPPKASASPSVMTIHDLKRNQQRKRKRSPELEEELVVEETARLERLDEAQSRCYQRGLLNLLSPGDRETTDWDQRKANIWYFQVEKERAKAMRYGKERGADVIDVGEEEGEGEGEDEEEEEEEKCEECLPSRKLRKAIRRFRYEYASYGSDEDDDNLVVYAKKDTRDPQRQLNSNGSGSEASGDEDDVHSDSDVSESEHGE
ncbi:uncharacterized protein LODBEIA_P59840 [Lodderomyces beijingensis]|uniref:Myb-like domain-containing protein n=1 Tax=Lodderomyces beijingensis TaxID=1775926 RepID=A0ABP0ZXF5_9ASCO